MVRAILVAAVAVLASGSPGPGGQAGGSASATARVSPQAGEAGSLFGIYLTAEPVPGRATIRGSGDWSLVRLAETPLISASDIISYDFTDHSMRLRPEALARIPRRPPLEGTPFVVVAHGQRVYLGVFYTALSSIPAAVPSIVVDWQERNQQPDTLVIDRAYPGTSAGPGRDPRADERIRTALKTLGKLKAGK